jgi:LCP family protein required for cell wall assembly
MSEGEGSRQASMPAARRFGETRLRTGALLASALVFLVATFFLFRIWGALHAIAPRTELSDLVTFVRGESETPGSLAWKIKNDKRINVLLLGYGGPGHYGAYLTDSILLVSIRPMAKEAVLVSIPRDLLVKVPALPQQGYFWAKLNTAYAIGADRLDFPAVREEWKGPTGSGDLAATTVSQVTGQPIDYWIGVDFKAFRDLVDALGGVRVDIPEPLDDPYFPAGETTRYRHIHFDAGPQRLDGEHALEYARSRQTTSDFDRSRRQRLILFAVRRQLLTLNSLPKLLSLVGALENNVRTNLRPVEMRELAALVSRIKEADIHPVGIDTTNFLSQVPTPDGGWVLLPYDPTYATLQRYLAFALPGRNLTAGGIHVQLRDGSTAYSLPSSDKPARLMAGALEQLGWKAIEGPPLVPSDQTQTEIQDGSAGRAPAAVAWLQNYFKARLVAVPASPAGPSVTVVLGSDFTSRAFPAPPSLPSSPFGTS